jgi:GcrA cell cycle regulator
MTWTPQRVDTLKKLWGEGHSCSRIAGYLGEITRNAVIGKVHRLGLPERATAIRKSHIASIRRSRSQAGKDREVKRAIEQKIETPKFDFEPIPVETDIPAKLYRLADWSETACQWPYTDVQTDSIKFGCGCERLQGKAYCAGHNERATQDGKRSAAQKFRPTFQAQFAKIVFPEREDA